MQELGVESSVLRDILSRKKTIEGRLRKDRFLDIKVGERLSLREDIWEGGGIKSSVPSRGIIRVTRIQSFKSFNEMLRALGFQSIIPGANNIEEALAVYRQFYTPENEKEFGVLALSFELV